MIRTDTGLKEFFLILGKTISLQHFKTFFFLFSIHLCVDVEGSWAYFMKFNINQTINNPVCCKYTENILITLISFSYQWLINDCKLYATDTGLYMYVHTHLDMYVCV